MTEIDEPTLPDLLSQTMDEDLSQMSTSMIEIEDENTRESTQSSNGRLLFIFAFLFFQSLLFIGESSRRSKSYGTRPLPVEVQHVEIHPTQIVEYEWPLKSGQKYFIQVYT